MATLDGAAAVLESAPLLGFQALLGRVRRTQVEAVQ